MSPPIETMDLRFDLLTPLHITDGMIGEMSPLEFVITTAQQLHHFDLPGFVDGLTASELREFTERTEVGSIPYICTYIGDLWNRHPQRFADYILWTASAGDLAPFYQNMIKHPEKRLFLKPFIKTNRRCFLPGSSLKGALRTALIGCLVESESLEDKTFRDSRDLEAETMWSLTLRRGHLFADATKDPFKALKTADAFFRHDDSIVKQVFNIKQDKDGQFGTTESRGILMFAECLAPGMQTDLQITIDSRFFNFPKKCGRRITVQEIIKACKSFYTKVLVHEKNSFFDAFCAQNPETDVASLYDRLMEINKQPDCFLLRIGRFGGRNSTSFNIYNRNGQEPVSRNLVWHAGCLMPLGWAMVTVQNSQSKTSVRSSEKIPGNKSSI